MYIHIYTASILVCCITLSLICASVCVRVNIHLYKYICSYIHTYIYIYISCEGAILVTHSSALM